MPKDSIDILWVVLCAGLVFNMQIGFLCLEAGLTRSKNAINVATKNMADLCIALLLYWLFGFALMFGTSQDGLMGSGLFMLDFAIDDSWPMAFFLFQAMFCTTAATIVSGAAAERMRFNAYLIVAALSAGLIYPLFGHWAWGGALREGQGWLAQQGFVDFAGSTVVHGVGGWIALATVMVIGPRAGRFDTKWLRQNMPGSNLPLAMLGGLLLLFGWFGFNGGSTLSFDGRVPGIVVNTVVAGMAGMALSMLLSQWRHGYIAPVALLNGMLAGLVAITASAHAVGIADSLLIGAGGGLAMWLSDRLLVRCGIDDAVGAVPVHLAAGLWGTVAVALFADPLLLGTGLGRLDQLMVQLQGVLVCAVWAFGVTYLLLRVINRYYPMRVDPDDERVGL
ncbi:MAG: ammonium transporter, partial [Gammaproteobacteria bacterium]|nr:ammonium transporter [Gammaproteobacteria bacterium]